MRLHRVLVAATAVPALTLGLSATALAASDTGKAPARPAQAKRQATPLDGHVTLSKGDKLTIPTWIFQNTTVCATAHTTAEGVYMTLDSQFPGAGPEDLYVPRYTRRHTAPTCRSAWWAGAPLDVSFKGFDPGADDPGAYLEVDYR